MQYATRIFFLLALALLLSTAAVAGRRPHSRVRRGHAAEPAGPVSLPVPTASQLQWAQREIGVIIHFDTSTFSPTANRLLGCTQRSPLDWHTFAPTAVNTSQWADAAHAVGAKYAVLAAKHACGFTLWPTKARFEDGAPYQNHIGNSPYGKDLADDYVNAFHRAGVAPGFYYSLTQNVYLNEWDGQVYTPFVSNITVTVTENQLIAIQTQQLTELWSNYGPLAEVWFDGGYPQIMEAMVEKLLPLQPLATAFQGFPAAKNPIRWSGTEGGSCAYPCWSTSSSGTDSGSGSPDGAVWDPAESDFTLQNGDNWFYSPTIGLHSLHELVDMYHQTVGHNANMLLDLAIAPTGQLPADAYQLYHTLGDWIRACYDHPVARTAAIDTQLLLELPADSKLDRVVIQEDQTFGQRIRTYTVQAMLNGEWSTVATGTSVGNKRIHLLDSAITTTQLKLTVTAAVSPAAISNFAAHLCDKP